MTWPAVSLGELCSVASGGTPSRTRPSYYGSDIPWVKISDMLQGTITHTDEHITREGLANSSAKVFPKGTLLLSIFATVGRTAILGIDAATNQAIAGITPDSKRLDLVFLRHYLDASVPELIKQSRGVAQVNINLSILKSHPIPLPPLDEQRRIAAMLDKAEELHAKRRAAIALLDQLPQAIFLEMFGDPFANPMNWPVEPLIRHVDVRRPITYGILKPGDDISDGVPYVRVVDMQDGGIRVDGLKRTTQAISHLYKRSLLQRGDVLLSIRGHVGRLAVVPANLEGANITQDTARLALQEMRPDFLVECLRTSSFQRWMARHTKGAAVKGINLGDVKEAPIPIPPSHLQDRFASALEPIRSARAAQRSALAESDAFFVSLQAQAFSGQLAKPMELSHD